MQAPPRQRRKPSPTNRFIGKVLGQKYRVVEPIGAGAMGMVYVVEHIGLKKRFAAKLLTADLARHPEAVARFETEARAVSQLEHENIVSVMDYGRTEDGCVFTIMELLRGQTLQARMDQGPLSEQEVVAIVMQVCQALAHAHVAGIVHRDIKPENIFLAQRPGGHPLVKVLDFGIAKARDGSFQEGRITRQGQLLGSPEYMSPEASRGEEVDSRADTYAVGVLLYELLCGRVPFHHEDAFMVLQMHAAHSPRAPREFAPDIPEPVERLILRALEKDPRRRQPSIQKLQLELMAALPEVAQRALLHNQAGPHGRWLPNTTPPNASQPVVRVSNDSNPALADTKAQLYAPVRPPGSSTLDIRRRVRRGVLVALWSGATAAAATAVFLVVMRKYEAARKPVVPPHLGSAVAGAQPGAAPGEYAPGSAKAIPNVRTDRPDVGDVGAPGHGEVRARTASPDRPGQPAQVRLRVATSPPGAVATLDGKSLGRTPIDTWVAASAGDGRLELELHGFRLARRTLKLDRDREIQISLRREPRRSNVRQRNVSRGDAAASPPRTARDEPDQDATRPPPLDSDLKNVR